MTDPASLASLGVLNMLLPPALFTDANLFSLAACKAVSLSLDRGNSDASCVAYVWLGTIAGPRFRDYKAGFRFGRVGYELVERRGLKRFAARTILCFAQFIVPWTKHVLECRELMRRAFEAAKKAGDLTIAGYCCPHLTTNLLAAGDSLVEAEREVESGLEFARKARFDFVVDIITGQVGLIRTLRGSTPKFGSFDDENFDEARFEHHLASAPSLALPECWYWIRKLQARFFAGDYSAAVDASLKAEQLMWTTPAVFEKAECYFYGSLARTMSCDSAAPQQLLPYREALTTYYEQLKTWAENCPENFETRTALVGAELARVEGRELEAERLFEQAIHSANANGFVQNEALAYEVAARFYAARGFATIANAYLQDARYGYLRWGANGKVKQLDHLYPHLREEAPSPGPTSTTVAPVELLDLATVIKVSQTVSGEIVLEKLIQRLMRAAIEHAGAERGLLIVPRGDELQMEAEASIGGENVIVHLRDGTHTPAALPESLVRYVMRTQETVMLDDASSLNPFSADPYFDQRRTRSILTLPLINQGKLIGILYLENNLTPRVFTPARVTVLKVLASQAAISLENTRLYRDLADREGKIRRLVDANILGIFIWNLEGPIVGANEAFLRMLQYGRDDLVSGRVRWTDLTPTEWRERDERALAELKATGTVQPYEKELLRKDGIPIPVLAGAALFEEGGNEGVAFVLDLSDQKRAEEKIREQEMELRQMLDLTPQYLAVLGADGSPFYANRTSLDYLGMSLDEWRQRRGISDEVHPDDVERLIAEGNRASSTGSAYELEVRVRKGDGSFRWFLSRFNPLHDDKGQVKRWYVASTDIEDRKRAEEKLQQENVALREELDKASMFEEIVGTSRPLEAILSRIAKVAPTDSTVLITGETGTGKELIARAVHKRSRRAGRAFISVNCAALPPTLVSSELFGHEKGAFTGATQRRLGRFEMAEGGTIFLDEVGELLPDTQAALLRVLQEREFERVGGGQPIHTDVRVIAATNRDLNAAVANGTFRQDLLYRLNVFPIEVPPLRERKEDLLMLVEYFVQRYANRAGRNIRSIDQKTLDLFHSYDWPGNIRELQNVIERSIILTSADVFFGAR